MTCDRSVVFSGYSSFLNYTDRHDIAEILLKVALDTINQSINKSKSEQMVIELLVFKHTFYYENQAHTKTRIHGAVEPA